MAAETVEPAEPMDPLERSAAQLATSLRAVPEIQRYGHLSLRDFTVRELLDRFAGTSLH